MQEKIAQKPPKYRLFDRKHFAIVKGISILIVIFAHLGRRYFNFHYLSPASGIATAVFLLCSGYGISESYKYRGSLRHYWENKIIRVWAPSLVKLLLVYGILLKSFFGWMDYYPLALYGWFLNLLFAEYLVFWLLFKYVDDRKLQMLGLFGTSLLAFLIVRDLPIAEGLFCFPLGVMASQYHWKKKIRALNNKQRAYLSAILVAVAGCAFVLRNMFDQYLLFNAVWMMMKVSLAILLILGVYFLRKIPLWIAFVPVGTISYALYLTYVEVLALLSNRRDWKAVVVVLGILFVVATIFYFGCLLIERLNRKTRTRNQVHLRGSMR